MTNPYVWVWGCSYSKWLIIWWRMWRGKFVGWSNFQWSRVFICSLAMNPCQLLDSPCPAPDITSFIRWRKLLLLGKCYTNIEELSTTRDIWYQVPITNQWWGQPPVSQIKIIICNPIVPDLQCLVSSEPRSWVTNCIHSRVNFWSNWALLLRTPLCQAIFSFEFLPTLLLLSARIKIRRGKLA